MGTTVNSDDTAPVWRSTRRCDNAACVEVAQLTNGVALRDSTFRDGPVLTFSNHAWAGFLADLRAGRWDGKSTEPDAG
ncbi:MAG TPA: DUF397 domain-containing protein [Natronosporangium sp.]